MQFQRLLEGVIYTKAPVTARALLTGDLAWGLLGVYLNVDQSRVFGLAMNFHGEAPSCMSLEVHHCR